MAKSVRWVAKGRRLGQTPNTPRSIDINETDDTVRIRAGDRIYGEPIDTPLAVRLIRNLWEAITDRDKLFTLSQTYRNLDAALAPPQNDSDKEAREKIGQLITVAQKWLDELLTHSFAVTLDKNILLKALSQPGCEGVRFYLCMKTENDEGVAKDILSLVSVGVDIKGKDLNYKYDSKKHDLKRVSAIENDSLNGEYGHTLQRNPFDEGNKSEMVPFVLFQYANHKFKY